jgi:hypothetical protein
VIRALCWVRALVGTAIAVVVLAGASAGARAQPLPPRPPTAVPLPTHAAHSNRHQTTVEATGRITGTVIDVTTGAPASGIAVVVGDASVKTDQNGNYDRNGLPAGTYLISLDLQPIQGMPEQGMVQVDLADGATVVQHLAFRSQPAATPTIAVATPVAATPVMPSRLPVTAAERDTAWLWGLAVLLVACGLCLTRIRARS